jgi:hypothetical protein
LARHPGATATNPSPSEEEVKDHGTANQALADHGIGSAGAGYDMSTLAAAVYARGWSYNIDRLGSDYRATVIQSVRELGQFQAVGTAWSMDAALAFALEKAFKIVRRRENLAAI